MDDDVRKLIQFLAEDCGWPLDEDQIDRSAWPVNNSELGLNEDVLVDSVDIYELRPLTTNQPWGVFFLAIKGTSKLSISLLRKLLRGLVKKKRASADTSNLQQWNLEDLMFVCSLDEPENKTRYFAHFKEQEKGLPKLMIGARWDDMQDYSEIQKEVKKLRKHLQWPDNDTNIELWREQWNGGFQIAHREVISSSEKLSKHLAKYATILRDKIPEIYNLEDEEGSIHRIFQSFSENLFKNLTIAEFADMIAQTITYGLFSSRVNADHISGLEDLEDSISSTNPFLKGLFSKLLELSGDGPKDLDFDDLSLTELIDMLNRCNFGAILSEFGSQFQGGNEDPVIHFYETFLAEYDKQKRIDRGVFYTPKPLVDFIVQTTHESIINEMGIPLGLADFSKHEIDGKKWHRIMILDPATGTGTFLVSVIEKINQTMIEYWKSNGKSKSEISNLWNDYVSEHLIPRINGFEIMMAPYTIAHLKIALKLKQTGYTIENDKRVGIYLTNALEEPVTLADWEPDFISMESKDANAAKKNIPYTVIIGNPPYSVSAQNNADFIKNLVNDYYSCQGKPLNEKNPKALQDDYVKFIRFGTHKIQSAEMAILSFVTNHGWLDNLTFRGMREQIINQFGKILVTDLNGSAMRKLPNDKNLFDIRQGVCSFNLINGKPEKPGIFFKNIIGNRASKISQLQSMRLDDYEQINPVPTNFFLVERSTTNADEFSNLTSITELFTKSSPGIKTHRDGLVYSKSVTVLHNLIDDFIDQSISNDHLSEKYNIKQTKTWTLDKARKMSRREGSKKLKERVVRTVYRPHEYRYLLLSDIFLDRPRMETMRGVSRGGNFALSVMRQVTGDIPYTHVLASKLCIDDRAMYSNRGTLTFFPMLLEKDGKLQSNLNSNVSSSLNQHLSDQSKDRELTDERIFDYIVAILHSKSYRKRYVDNLLIEFPRIAFTSDQNLFYALSDIGNQIKNLDHLNSKPNNEALYSVLSKEGYTDYDIDKGFLCLDKSIDFCEISAELFNQYIGGYQPIARWFKKNKKHQITASDARELTQIVDCMRKLNECVEQIDQQIIQSGGWPLKGQDNFLLLRKRESGQTSLFG